MGEMQYVRVTLQPGNAMIMTISDEATTDTVKDYLIGNGVTPYSVEIVTEKVGRAEEFMMICKFMPPLDWLMARNKYSISFSPN